MLSTMRAALLALTTIAACAGSQSGTGQQAGLPTGVHSTASAPTWNTDEQTALQQAQATGRGLLVDFAAEWCLPCKRYDAEVFRDPAVSREIADHYIPLRIDATRETPELTALAHKYGVTSLPAIVLIGPDGAELDRVGELLPAPTFLYRLQAARDSFAPARTARIQN